MSDTPRVDDKIIKLEEELGDGPPCLSQAAIDVAVRLRLTALARQLERELAAMTKLNREHVRQLDEAAKSPQSAIEAPDDMRLYVEHGYITLRTEGGWLLWECKIGDMPSIGLDVRHLLTEAHGKRLSPTDSGARDG